MRTSLFPSSRQAIAIGLGFVAVISLAAIPPGAVLFPALAVAVLAFAPAPDRRRAVPASSARMRAVALASTADALLWMALGAAIGLAYLLVVLQL